MFATGEDFDLSCAIGLETEEVYRLAVRNHKVRNKFISTFMCEIAERLFPISNVTLRVGKSVEFNGGLFLPYLQPSAAQSFPVNKCIR
jgi:uncharacterized protein YlaI